MLTRRQLQLIEHPPMPAVVIGAETLVQLHAVTEVGAVGVLLALQVLGILVAETTHDRHCRICVDVVRFRSHRTQGPGPAGPGRCTCGPGRI